MAATAATTIADASEGDHGIRLNVCVCHERPVQLEPKPDGVLDLISFDPALRNMGVAYVRYAPPSSATGTAAATYTVLRAALVDVYDPELSMRRDDDGAGGGAGTTGRKRSAARKPAHVQAYWAGGCAPDDDDGGGAGLASTPHAVFVDHTRERVRERAAADARRLRDGVDLLPAALDCVPWLRDAARTVDRVLIEDQQRDNHGMRSVAHCIQAYFETRWAALRARGVAVAARVDFVSARVKLSKAVIADVARLCLPALRAASAAHVRRVLRTDAGVDCSTYARTKTSAVRWWRYVLVEQRRAQLDARVGDAHGGGDGDEADDAARAHPFVAWLDAQRAAKHNVVDAVLQALAWLHKTHRLPHVGRA